MSFESGSEPKKVESTLIHRLDLSSEESQSALKAMFKAQKADLISFMRDTYDITRLGFYIKRMSKAIDFEATNLYLSSDNFGQGTTIFHPKLEGVPISLHESLGELHDSVDINIPIKYPFIETLNQIGLKAIKSNSKFII